ncbi:MAG: 3-phosphoshikimate 1-carboxyvinyltransferase [Acidobacteria bacterium]|nr:3-phosphoshikimate 1-carboxyvinyltransferase [Acidobacteriota bacterium]
MLAGKPAATVVPPADRLRGRLRVPGDKSISHRYALLAALADGESTIAGYSIGADCRSTLACLRGLGVRVEAAPDAGGERLAVTVAGGGPAAWRPTDAPLDAGNSGTTMRLLAGILAGCPFTSTLMGDASLSRRPMQRIIEPLTAMGARIAAAEGGRPPLAITGGALTAIDYTLPVASAQVKSAVLLAGLRATGTTCVHEPVPTRDHTERALAAFGVPVVREAGAIEVTGGARLRGTDLTVPGDPSAAAFWIASAAALSGSELTIEGTGLNPTRTAFIDVLRGAGAVIDTRPAGGAAGEPAGDVSVRGGTLRPIVIGPADVPGLIDELPVIGALAAHGVPVTVSGAGELRHKESDRIAAFAAGLRALGAPVDERPDGFHAESRERPAGGTADAAGDHRLAMAFAVAALACEGPSTITGAEAVDVSYPGFFAVLDALRQ